MSESEKKYGIESLKKAVDFGASLHIAYQMAEQDGKIDIQDAPLLFPPALALVQVLGVAGSLPKEFGDLDEDEKAALFKHVEDNYNVADDKIELFVKRCLKIAVELGDLVEDFVSGDAT